MSNATLQEDQLFELLLTLKGATPEDAKTILNSQPQIAYALMAVMVNINAVKMEVVQQTLAAYGAIPGTAAPAPTPPTVPPSAIPAHVASQIPQRGSTPTYSQQGPPGYPPQGPPQGYPPQHPTPPPHMQQGYGRPPPHGYQQGPPPGYPAHQGYPQHQPPPQNYPPGGYSQQGYPPQGPPHGYGNPSMGQGPPGYGQPPSQQQRPPGPPTSGQPAQANGMIPEALAGLPDEQKAMIMRVISMTRDEVFALPPAERENIIKLRTTLGLPT